MTDTARHFCVTAIIVALATLIAGIAVAVDAIAASRRCPPPAIEAACVTPPPPVGIDLSRP
jgi:hypothetical protein